MLTERRRQSLIPKLCRRSISIKAMANCHVASQGTNEEWAPQALTVATTRDHTDRHSCLSLATEFKHTGQACGGSP